MCENKAIRILRHRIEVLEDEYKRQHENFPKESNMVDRACIAELKYMLGIVESAKEIRNSGTDSEFYNKARAKHWGVK